MMVTQGTTATDPRNLVLPAIQGLAEADALVVATAIGFGADEVLLADDRPATCG
jgi:hypothetical protein